MYFKINLRENVQEEPPMSKQIQDTSNASNRYISMKIDSLGNYSQIEIGMSHYHIQKYTRDLYKN